MESVTQNKSPLIMLIDDSIMDLFINKKVIESFGSESKILEYNLGTKALEYLISNRYEHEKIPDIILLDIYMPYMNGFEFLDEYEKLPFSIRSKISLFMLSSSLDPVDIKNADQNRNVKRLFQKPMTRNTIDEMAKVMRFSVSC